MMRSFPGISLLYTLVTEPPSTRRLAPVINEAASDARKTTAATIGMRDQNGRARLGTQHLPHPRQVTRERGQIKLDGSHAVACLLEALNDGTPTGAVRPGPVNQHHVGYTHAFPAFASRMEETPPGLSLLTDLQLLGDEGERGLGHVTPSVVNRQGMPAIGDFADLRDRGIVLLSLVGGMGDRPRHGVVFLA